MTLLIRPVAETPHLPTIAAWLHAQWWAAGGYSLEATEAFLRRATGPAAPCALVAEQDGIPLGTATFDTDDLPSRPDLAPWLASVLVTPEARRQGVATALVRAVEGLAAAQGVRRLWLFTPDQAPFYAARGWVRSGEEQYRGSPVVLMHRDLG
ncbi:GNAT family N-acetyltransferase [Roseomonas stagni]|uniref:GNAT family N-acetyltransferase n=1 Tax=Falsiroseomonas algicola TaxID=2716930 RepID=A0A6M1LHJ4_9PROT|nr:GNAT family N-acetyltransferase [Falsiroseomonas algicola]NGM19384.1 GNAT family N-acetyltransferase [Falsiroseomonas algicola]